MADWHLLRPLCLWAFIPLGLLLWMLWRKRHTGTSWDGVCDTHLLPHLLQPGTEGQRYGALLWLFVAIGLLIIGWSGPTWNKLPVPTFARIKPHVLLLDMSQAMAETDVSPSRLERAKFLIQDILAHRDAGQFALIAYTSEPFVVAPLTEDGNTIAALLSSLTLTIMPVGGSRLSPALQEARQLLRQAGYEQGEILIFSAHPPAEKAVQEAAALAAQGIRTSVMPMQAEGGDAPAWQQLARQGEGLLLNYAKAAPAITQWLSQGSDNSYLDKNALDDIPLWRDEGRWFVLAGSLLLLVVFRRGWLQRMAL
ncbi:MAG: VWA domain-containing protein [Legionellaceae bacterium]|nr:VWA domain-containing protein [Legionellaceae bacterium]